MVDNLLTIRVKDENSVPEVFYKGEEVTNKINISFNWETKTDEFGGLQFLIDHFKKKETQTVRETHAHRTGKFLLED